MRGANVQPAPMSGPRLYARLTMGLHIPSRPLTCPASYSPEVRKNGAETVPNVPKDAISTSGVQSVGQAEADLSASSAFDPPAPSDIFLRLGVMLVVALGFGLSAQCVLAVLQH
jgi:hypothetical protein